METMFLHRDLELTGIFNMHSATVSERTAPEFGVTVQVLLIESTLTQMFIDAVGADWAANW